MLKDLFFNGIGLEKNKGQVLTPSEIIDYMVGESIKTAMQKQPKDKPLQILDPACGTGRFMLGVADYCFKNSLPFLMWNIDIDERMTEATIKHAEFYKIPSVVILGNALLNEFKKAWRIDNGIREEIEISEITELFNGIIDKQKECLNV